MMSRLHVLRFFAVVILAALPLAVRGTAAQEDTFLAIAQDPAVGSFLTDAEGNTLYLFTPDTTPGESIVMTTAPRPGRSSPQRRG